MSAFNIRNLTPEDAYHIGCVFGILSNICDNSNSPLCPSTDLRDIYFTIGRYYAVNQIDFNLMSHFLEAFSSNFIIAYYDRNKCLVDNSNNLNFVDVMYQKDNQWIIDTIGINELYGFDNDTDDEN
jgi:hypothetical protein